MIQDIKNQILADIRNILAADSNGKVCLGYQTLGVDNTPGGVKLTVPAGAQSAEITIEDAGSTSPSQAVRYTLDGSTTPVSGASSAAGVPLGDFDTVEILGNTNLNNFKVIAVDAANTKYLKIHYFS